MYRKIFLENIFLEKYIWKLLFKDMKIGAGALKLALNYLAKKKIAGLFITDR